MIPEIPALGVRFDIDKLESAAYGLAAWKVFWRAVEISKLAPGTLLFAGDTSATLNGSENVTCIAVQSFDSSVLDAVRDALDGNKEFSEVASSPRFVTDKEVTGEPLLDAGRIDAEGGLAGDSWARVGLDAVRND